MIYRAGQETFELFAMFDDGQPPTVTATATGTVSPMPGGQAPEAYVPLVIRP